MLQVHKQTTLRSSRVFLNAQSFQEIFSISLCVATKALVELSWSNFL